MVCWFVKVKIAGPDTNCPKIYLSAIQALSNRAQRVLGDSVEEVNFTPFWSDSNGKSPSIKDFLKSRFLTLSTKLKGGGTKGGLSFRLLYNEKNEHYSILEKIKV